MHARVVTLQVLPDKMDEVNALFQNEVVPGVRQLPGFMSLTLLEDRKARRALMISVWATEQALKDSEGPGFFQTHIQKFTPMLEAPPYREIFEVGAQS